MGAEQLKIHIVIIDNDVSEIAEIQAWLESDMRVPWTICHCVDVKEARSVIHKADLVILKPDTDDLPSSKEVFKNLEGMVFEVPIIVLTNAEDQHGLSTFVMEQGAADTIIRGQFARLVDAIEFALIRQKITTDARRVADQALSDTHDKRVSDLSETAQVRASETEKSRQILRMFSGDYAVDAQDKTKTTK